MIPNDEQPFKQRLLKLLTKKNLKKYKEVNDIIFVLKKPDKDLLIFLKSYLSVAINPYNQNAIINKIIELTFDELIRLAGDDLVKIKELYDIFNLLSLQKLSNNPQILQKLYKTLALQDSYGCSGLYLILTKYKNKDAYILLQKLINLAKDNPERITDIYSALPIQNKYKQSALNILFKEQPQTRLNQIKRLIQQSYFQNLINTFMPKQRIITQQIKDMQPYYLACLSTTSELPILTEHLDKHKHLDFLECSDSRTHLNQPEQQSNIPKCPLSPTACSDDDNEQSDRERQRSDTQSSQDEQCSNSSSSQHSKNQESLEKKLRAMEITTVTPIHNPIIDFYKAKPTNDFIDEIDPPTLSNAMSSEIKTSLSSIEPELPSLPGSITNSPAGSLNNSPQHKTSSDPSQNSSPNASPTYPQTQNPLSLFRVGPSL